MIVNVVDISQSTWRCEILTRLAGVCEQSRKGRVCAGSPCGVHDRPSTHPFLLRHRILRCPRSALVASRIETMRFMPRMFMLASSEDAEAQQLLMHLFLLRAQELEIDMTNAFLDCSCYYAVAAAAEEQGLGLRLHRCLEHAPARPLVGEGTYIMFCPQPKGCSRFL